jgi:hypothetical protein
MGIHGWQGMLQRSSVRASWALCRCPRRWRTALAEGTCCARLLQLSNFRGTSPCTRPRAPQVPDLAP